MSNTNEPLANIMAEMRNRADTIVSGRVITERNFVPQETVEAWTRRIEAAVRHQFQMIQSLCQAEIDSALSDRISAIFMLKVVRDIAQDQLSKLSPMEGGKRTTMAEQGNNAAMREALVQCELFLGNLSRHGHPTLNPGDKCTACAGVDELRGIVVRALSMPARNCDVGTAKEQIRRFDEFCGSLDCHECPIYELTDDGGMEDCALTWAQMPYGKEESNG